MKNKFINSTLLFLFVIFGGTYSLIGPIRFIEVLSPILLILIINKNGFFIPFNLTSKIFFLSIFGMFLWIFFTYNSDSLFSIRLISSLIACITLYYMSKVDNYFALFPRYFLLLSILFYSLEVYKYFWEYTYIFSLLLASLVYFRNYFLSIIDIIFLFIIGQRTSILNIGYIFFSNLILTKLTFAKIFIIILIFFLSLFTFQNLDNRSINAYRNLDIVKTYDSFFYNLKQSSDYTYDEFVYQNKNELRQYVKDNNQDLSLNIRFRKWTHAISNSNFKTLFLGLGPGYFDKGADSGLIRLFFEYGLIIFTIFFLFIYIIFKKSNSLQKMIIAVFFITNVFLDILFAPMLMGFTGLMLGLATNAEQVKRSINQKKIKKRQR